MQDLFWSCSGDKVTIHKFLLQNHTLSPEFHSHFFCGSVMKRLFCTTPGNTCQIGNVCIVATQFFLFGSSSQGNRKEHLTIGETSFSRNTTSTFTRTARDLPQTRSKACRRRQTESFSITLSQI